VSSASSNPSPMSAAIRLPSIPDCIRREFPPLARPPYRPSPPDRSKAHDAAGRPALALSLAAANSRGRPTTAASASPSI